MGRAASAVRLAGRQYKDALLGAETTLSSEGAGTSYEFEWRVARAVATIHGVSALLAHTLPWKGPESWRQFLAEQSEHTATRHRHMQQVLADATRWGEQIGGRA